MVESLTEAAKVCIVVTTTLGLIAIITVVLRFYCRLKIQKINLGPDDWCAFVAVVLSTGIAVATNYAAATTGVGDLAFQPSIDQVIFALKMNVGLENSQVACMGIIKVSLLLYYKRILTLQSYQRLTDILIGIVIAFEFSLIMAILLSKGLPISRQWDPLSPFVVDVSAILLTLCAGNALLDLLTLALPIIAVRSLQIRTSKKLVVSVIFSLGSFCIIASIVRLYYAVQFTKVTATANSFFQAPFIYNILWALIEPPVFILAGCLLTLAPLFRAKFNLGPVSLLRSLRSAILSRRKPSTAATSSDVQKDGTASLYAKLDGNSGRKLCLSPIQDAFGERLRAEDDWELTDINGPFPNAGVRQAWARDG